MPVECVNGDGHIRFVCSKPADEPAFGTMCMYDLWFEIFDDV